MTCLARALADHGRAVEYDLMTRTGRTLSEYMAMGAPGRAALVAFLRYVPPDSPTWRAMHPREADDAAWTTVAKTNVILADIYDAFAQANSRKGRKPRPYPRPNARGRTIGNGAIRVRDFEKWWRGEA